MSSTNSKQGILLIIGSSMYPCACLKAIKWCLCHQKHHSSSLYLALMSFFQPTAKNIFSDYAYQYWGKIAKWFDGTALYEIIVVNIFLINQIGFGKVSNYLNQMIVDYIEKKSASMGLETLFLLTTRTADWYVFHL